MVDLISDKWGNLLQVLEGTGRLHQDLAQKVHPGSSRGSYFEAQVGQMPVAHECQGEEATASTSRLHAFSLRAHTEKGSSGVLSSE